MTHEGREGEINIGDTLSSGKKKMLKQKVISAALESTLMCPSGKLWALEI